MQVLGQEGVGYVVVVDADDKEIAAVLGEVQQAQMAGMDDVEVAGHKDDLTDTFCFLANLNERLFNR